MCRLWSSVKCGLPAVTPPSLDGDPLPLLGAQVEAPELLADVAAPHDAPVHVQPPLVHHGRVPVPLAWGAGSAAVDLQIGTVCFLYLNINTFKQGKYLLPCLGGQVELADHAALGGSVEELATYHPHRVLQRVGCRR